MKRKRWLAFCMIIAMALNFGFSAAAKTSNASYDDGSYSTIVSTWGRKVGFNLASLCASSSIFEGIAYVR